MRRLLLLLTALGLSAMVGARPAWACAGVMQFHDGSYYTTCYLLPDTRPGCYYGACSTVFCPDKDFCYDVNG